MKQVFTLIKNLDHKSRVPSLNGIVMKFSKVLFILWLAASAFINSSFKSEIHQSRVETANFLKNAVPFKGRNSVSLELNEKAGTGVASHIGRFEYDLVDDASNFPFLTGTATFTAANGDQTLTTFSGNLEDFGNGMLNVSFDHIITGELKGLEGQQEASLT